MTHEPKHAKSEDEEWPVKTAPTSGFPKNPPEDPNLPTIEGVRPITQDPSFDPDVDEEPDEFAPINEEEIQ